MRNKREHRWERRTDKRHGRACDDTGFFVSVAVHCGVQGRALSSLDPAPPVVLATMFTRVLAHTCVEVEARLAFSCESGDVASWGIRSQHSVQVNEVGFRALTNCSDSTGVRVEMFKKYQVHEDQLEECPRAKQVRQNESQANSLVQLHKMTAYLGHFDWVVKALKQEQNIAVKQRRRVGRMLRNFAR